jgi:hypothetical protein
LQVLRRWRHRWHKNGEETPFKYQSIAKLIEIGLRCQEHDPSKRPFISEIIRDLNEMERTDRPISNANESTIRQVSSFAPQTIASRIYKLRHLQDVPV